MAGATVVEQASTNCNSVFTFGALIRRRKILPQNPPEVIPPIYNFFRQVNEAAGHRDRLPKGQIFSDGDSAESCVTGIVVDARPPPS